MVKHESGFAGFGAEGDKPLPVPTEFFTELLPAIDHLGELRVTLYALWACGRQGSANRHLRRSEILADDRLVAAFEGTQATPQEALDEALERAVGRGTLLRAVEGSGEGEVLYFLNDPRGRAAHEGLQQGDWQPETGGQGLQLEAERPNIYVLYEQNIGALTPLLAERLREAEREYPESWIEEAISIAVENNVRKWRYVQAILEDWKTKGRDDREDRRDAQEARQRYLGGEFGEFIEH